MTTGMDISPAQKYHWGFFARSEEIKNAIIHPKSANLISYIVFSYVVDDICNSNYLTDTFLAARLVPFDIAVLLFISAIAIFA